jgi:hypothetical protein
MSTQYRLHLRLSLQKLDHLSNGYEDVAYEWWDSAQLEQFAGTDAVTNCDFADALLRMQTAMVRWLGSPIGRMADQLTWSQPVLPFD